MQRPFVETSKKSSVDKNNRHNPSSPLISKGLQFTVSTRKNWGSSAGLVTSLDNAGSNFPMFLFPYAHVVPVAQRAPYSMGT
jgi:hypothetical protein